MMEKKKKYTTKNITIIAVFVALLSVCSWISFSFGTIPVTLQTFGVFVTAGLLGCSMGTSTVIIYILLGVLGIPVFSGFTSGIAKFVPNSETGATGGYIIGFILTAIVIGLFQKIARKASKEWVKVTWTAVGMIVGDCFCYIAGTVWFVLWNPWNMGVEASIGACVLPFIIPDLIKIALATILVNRMEKFIKLY